MTNMHQATISHERTTPTVLDWIATVLLIVGGLNWGLVGLARFDLVATLFGDFTPLSRIVYVLVGLAAIYAIIRAFTHRRTV